MQGLCAQTWRAGAFDSEHRVHAFFYLWYGNPEHDSAYLHWNHKVLPHWREEVSAQYPVGKEFQPPQDVHSTYYPAKGCYSSRDPAVIREQLDELAAAGVTVAVLSWWGQGDRNESADTQGVSTDALLPIFFRAAEAQGTVKLAFHLEPYAGRSAKSVLADVAYLMERFGASPALLRWQGKPVYYVYDSYLTPSGEWAAVLKDDGDDSVRGTDIDGVFIGLWLDYNDGEKLETAGFDGAYSYFASEGSSYGSTWSSWPRMATWATDHRKFFIASVGPGYNDTRIRPWNGGATRAREEGRLYERAWRHAIDAGADVISITSYNEWGEGTQIEPAKPAVTSDGAPFDDYGASGPSSYLDLTKTLVGVFKQKQRNSQGPIREEL